MDGEVIVEVVCSKILVQASRIDTLQQSDRASFSIY